MTIRRAREMYFLAFVVLYGYISGDLQRGDNSSNFYILKTNFKKAKLK